MTAYDMSSMFYFGDANNLWDTTKLAQLAYNLNCGSTRANYQYTQTTAPASISQATAGTWTTLATWTLAANALPGLVSFQANINRSAAVANWIRVGLFRNGVLQTSYVFDVAPITLEIPTVSTNGGTTDTWDLKWMVTLSPAVTYTMPNGYRIAHYQI